jgi:hypothetical protein
VEAWRDATGLSSAVALIDDGSDPAMTSLCGNSSTALSRNFGAGAETVGLSHVTNAIFA